MTFSVSVFLLLVIVLSLDAFTAGLSYGIEKVKVPLSSLMIIAMISGAMLTLSLFAGHILLNFISPTFTKVLSFLVLFLLSLYKFYDAFPRLHFTKHRLTTEVITQNINKHPKEILSLSEAVVLATALSIDNVSAGICTGMILFSVPLTLLVTFFIHLISLSTGVLTGCFFFKNSSKNFSWLGAAILMLLALLRLV